MSDDEIKLTTKNNVTNTGVPFPETPKPQILKEHFASYETNNSNENNNKKDSNNE